MSSALLTRMALWRARIEAQPFLILDGGLATDLERHGASLHDALWSARLVLDAPEQVIAAHQRYAAAGADILTTASYQATPDNLAARGLSEPDIRNFYETAATLAARSAKDVGATCLVAGSAGSYGAFLADGSEYRGHYGVSEGHLRDFHLRRVAHLVATNIDAIAFETVPCLLEAYALSRVSAELDVPVWISFSCRDGSHVCSGEPLRDCIAAVADVSQVIAVGINCVAPGDAEALLFAAREVTDKPLIVYPNAGERWSDADGWHGPRVEPEQWPVWAERFLAAGAKIIGGCCRTAPEHIAALHRWRRGLGSGKRTSS